MPWLVILPPFSPDTAHDLTQNVAPAAARRFSPGQSSTVHPSVLQWGMQKSLALAFALLFSCIAAAQPAPLPPDLTCRWSAQLTAARSGVAETYTVPFDLDIESTSAGLRAALLNGSDRIEFSSAAQQGSDVVLRLDQYDAALTAHCTSGQPACSALQGEYVRQRGDAAAHYALNAHCSRPPVADSPKSAEAPPPRFSIAADWQFAFTDASGKPDSEPTAPAHFTADADHVEGTIAPISGDYGMLAGALAAGADGEIHLSRFDGIHLLRLDGHFVSADRIEGIFHVAPGHPLSFVATRASTAHGFEEAERLTSVENPSEPFRFHGLDASGSTITQADPAFHGKVVLLDIFGTWCPNCHDEAPVLQSLYAKFHARGLAIVGLSYEYVDDTARSQRLLGVYRRKYSIAFPLLLAGTTATGQIAATLPQLRNFGAFPTTIFLDRRGRVRLIHAGFSGPATGRLEEVEQTFERTIVKLLDEQ
jgi:thiol-disulfide isomerase/thioredoxin